MKNIHSKSFPQIHQAISILMKNKSNVIHTDTWQGLPITDRPEARMRELCFLSLEYKVPSTIAALVQETQPNLPWAERHFLEERVSGEPINPGETWKIWPWGHSADKFRTETDQFNHSYAERYWPKFAARTGAELTAPIRGIRYYYGDLRDVINLLARDSLTRQAYLPVFFPEDTGAVHRGRVPCSIGYHFILRDGKLHVVYQLRSCDFFRHFRDDVYLTARLLQWVLEELRKLDQNWQRVSPGNLMMHIGSLHMFENDFRKMFLS